MIAVGVIDTVNRALSKAFGAINATSGDQRPRNEDSHRNQIDDATSKAVQQSAIDMAYGASGTNPANVTDGTYDFQMDDAGKSNPVSMGSVDISSDDGDGPSPSPRISQDYIDSINGSFGQMGFNYYDDPTYQQLMDYGNADNGSFRSSGGGYFQDLSRLGLGNSDDMTYDEKVGYLQTLMDEAIAHGDYTAAYNMRDQVMNDFVADANMPGFVNLGGLPSDWTPLLTFTGGAHSLFTPEELERARSDPRFTVEDRNPFNIADDLKKQAMSDAAAYRLENSGSTISDAFNEDGTSSDAVRRIYEDDWNSRGGLEQGYETGMSTLGRAFASAASDPTYFETDPTSYLQGQGFLDVVGQGLDKLANENYDDGTLRADSVKGQYMSGAEYRRLREEHPELGGRPLYLIDDTASYNKLDELRDYGFIPYIEDEQQLRDWQDHQLANDFALLVTDFTNARDLYTSPTFKYKGQTIDRDRLEYEARRYSSDFSNGARYIMSVPLDDGSTYEFSTSLEPIGGYAFDASGENGEYPALADHPEYGEQFREIIADDPSISRDQFLIYYPDAGVVLSFEDQEDIDNNFPTIVGATPDRNLEYTQADGTIVSLTPEEFIDVITQLDNNTMPIDYGHLNIAKNASDGRDELSDMIVNHRIDDILPFTADLLLGSAPIMVPPYVSMPIASTEAMGLASAGLDTRLYNNRDNAYHRIAGTNPYTGENLMTGDRFLSNIGVTAGMPLTERLAGGIGGSGGVLGRPVLRYLENRGAPWFASAAANIVGEGVEEDIGTFFEDLQANGFGQLFANPEYQAYVKDGNGDYVLDEDGSRKIVPYSEGDESLELVIDRNGEPRVLLDTAGQEIRNSGATTSVDYVGNYLDKAFEDFLAGAYMGGMFETPRTAKQAITRTGAFSPEAIERRQKKRFMDMYSGRGDSSILLAPEDYGTYEQRR